MIDEADIPNEVLKRIEDYNMKDPTEARKVLVELWRKHYPEAARESSAALHPLIKSGGTGTLDDPERYFNDVYNVTVRLSKDTCFGQGAMIQIGIWTLDGTARHDWREMQAIKNQIAGPECEAFELYPAESRLLDPSNYYSLWCFPDVKRIHVGRDVRQTFDADMALSPQRALPKEDDGDHPGV